MVPAALARAPDERLSAIAPASSGGQDHLRWGATQRGTPKGIVQKPRYEQSYDPRDIHTAERLDKWACIKRGRKKRDLNQNSYQVDNNAGHIPSPVSPIRI